MELLHKYVKERIGDENKQRGRKCFQQLVLDIQKMAIHFENLIKIWLWQNIAIRLSGLVIFKNSIGLLLYCLRGQSIAPL